MINRKNKKIIKQRGSILIFSILILAVIMSITFAVLGILIPKLRIASNPIKSTIALSAADSGLEWCLYVNRDHPLSESTAKPVFSEAEVKIYPISGGSSITESTCDPSEFPLRHRAVGTYLGVARSLELEESIPTPQCSDGIDNTDPEDFLVDLSDPGCSGLSDSDETDRPQCSDGADNDGDGFIDYPGDPGCSSLADTSEADTFDYILSNTGNIPVIRGASGANTIIRTLVAGTTQPVTLSVSLGGSSCNPTCASQPTISVQSITNNSPACSPTCSSTLTLATTTSTPAGTYPITVTGSSLSRTTVFNLVVGLPFDYSLNAAGNITVNQGSAGATSITRTLVAGTTQPVTLSVSLGGSSCNPTCASQPTISVQSITNNPCSPDCTSTVTLLTTSSTPVGTYNITVTGSPLSRTETFDLIVNAIPPTPILTIVGPAAYHTAIGCPSPCSLDLSSRRYLTTPGTYTITINTDANIRVKAAAGGGGGGDGDNIPSNQGGGGGGGGAAHVSGAVITMSSGNNYRVIVGSGGLGGNPGGTGGTTSFEIINGAQYLYLLGGQGGQSGNSGGVGGPGGLWQVGGGVTVGGNGGNGGARFTVGGSPSDSVGPAGGGGGGGAGSATFAQNTTTAGGTGGRGGNSADQFGGNGGPGGQGISGAIGADASGKGGRGAIELSSDPYFCGCGGGGGGGGGLNPGDGIFYGGGGGGGGTADVGDSGRGGDGSQGVVSFEMF